MYDSFEGTMFKEYNNDCHIAYYLCMILCTMLWVVIYVYDNTKFIKNLFIGLM